MRLCDVCHLKNDGIEDLGLGAYNKPDAGLAVTADVKPLATADVCGTCRKAIEQDGLADGIAERVKERPRTRRSRAASSPVLKRHGYTPETPAK